MSSIYKATNEAHTIPAVADKSTTIIYWRHTHAKGKGLDNIDSASLCLWNRGAILDGKFKGDSAGTTWASLTRNEKLKLIENHLKAVYLALAAQQNVDTAVEVARTTAEADNITKFDLNGS